MDERTRKIEWTAESKTDLQNIYRFIAQYSVNYARNVINRILKKPEILLIQGFENAAQIDDINLQFRRLIEGNYKIMYIVENDCIKIVRVFDCRQNPEKLKNIK